MMGDLLSKLGNSNLILKYYGNYRKNGGIMIRLCKTLTKHGKTPQTHLNIFSMKAFQLCKSIKLSKTQRLSTCWMGVGTGCSNFEFQLIH
jgi:hypothetical protein